MALIRSFEKIIEVLTGKESIWNIVLPFLSLGLIPIEIARESVYWFSAAGTYLLPLGVCVPLLNKLAIYASGNTPMSRFAATAIVVGCFLGGFSAESIAVAFCCAVLGLLVTAHKQRRLFLAFCLCMSITGALCLLLAPGNFQRLGTEKVPFLDRLSENVNLILFYLYSDITYTFILFFAFCCIGVGIYSFKKSRRIAVKVLDVLGVGCSAVFSILMLFEKTGLYPILQISGMDALYICTILLLYSFLLVWEFGRFFFLRGTDETGLSARVGIVQWVMSIVALGALGATPTLPIRTLLPFVLTASLSGAVAFGVLLSDITAAVSERNFCLCNREVLSRCIRMLLLLCFMFFTVPNMLEIYQGYAENYLMQETNHQRLLGAQNASEPIELMRLKDDVFCYVMPYMYDGEFQPLIEGEMKRYYGLPEETTFIWR